MLARVVAIEEPAPDRPDGRIEREGPHGDAGHQLRARPLLRGPAASGPQVNGPCERDEDRRHLGGVEPSPVRVLMITAPVSASYGAVDLRALERGRDRHGAVEVVGVGRPERRDRATGLGPGGRARPSACAPRRRCP